MTLFDLTQGLFEYLVRFREKAPTVEAPTFAQARNDFIDIFSRMDAQARADISLAGPYQQIRYALTVLADDVILNSSWDQAPRWKRECLELRFFGTEAGGSRFFDLAEDLGKTPKDVAAIYYLCLALGFRGERSPDDPRLEALKEKLATRLPRAVRKQPQAHLQDYRHASPGLGAANTDRQDKATPKPGPATAPTARRWAPLAGLAAMAVVVAAALWFWQPWQGEVTPPTQVAKVARPQASPPSYKASITSAPPTTLPPSRTTATSLTTVTTTSSTTTTRTTTTTLAPAPAPAPKAAAPAPAPQPRYQIQVGVFVGPLQSGRLVKKLIKKGWPARLEKWSRGPGKIWYVVMVGPIKGVEKAAAIQTTLQNELKIKTFLQKIRDNQ